MYGKRLENSKYGMQNDFVIFYINYSLGITLI